MSALALFLPLASIILLCLAISRVWKKPGDFIEIFKGKVSGDVMLAFACVVLANICLFIFIEVLSYL
ncbi:hypothetical protein [Roseicyclus amphidinii]|uniref:hypothetical protein n=1 Tax=Roseicyclus amphidinii TaxID=3034232 RepID=UPI0024E0FEAB|nr:hypothetical protein [Roseicyclus sp. Amp-Y-6]